MLKFRMLLLVFLYLGTFVSGQEKISRQQYIDTYADLAMKEMVRTGIPASIKLAQACLESDNGNSRLAVVARNHFGIKCHDDWTGRKTYHDDDENDECFRRYRTVNESFIDHSDFLVNKSRYAELFQLRKDDYQGWANGLKKAGYATSKDYADLLIKIIEDNQLYQYDQMVLDGRLRPVRRIHDDEPPVLAGRQILSNNRIEYIIIQPGDTPEALREELELYPGEIFRYNDIDRNTPLDSGMVIYLQPKRWKAARGNEIHIVREGETMWDISQYYGVKLSRLYKLNRLPEDASVEQGEKIWLRRKIPDERENMFRQDDAEEKSRFRRDNAEEKNRFRRDNADEEMPSNDSSGLKFQFDG